MVCLVGLVCQPIFEHSIGAKQHRSVLKSDNNYHRLADWTEQYACSYRCVVRSSFGRKALHDASVTMVLHQHAWFQKELALEVR